MINFPNFPSMFVIYLSQLVNEIIYIFINYKTNLKFYKLNIILFIFIK